jgi:hypothetical protein
MLYGTPDKSSVDFLLLILEKVTLQRNTAHAEFLTSEKKQRRRAGKCSSVS